MYSSSTHVLVIHPQLSHFSYGDVIATHVYNQHVNSCKVASLTSVASPIVAPYSKQLVALLNAKKSLYANNSNVYIFPKIPKAA